MGIANLKIDEFQQKIKQFPQKYVDDWSKWLETNRELQGIIEKIPGEYIYGWNEWLKNNETFTIKIQGFPRMYANYCNIWLKTQEDRAKIIGSILRKWQACRPNKMRRTRVEYEHKHPVPYLENLIAQAKEPLKILNEKFDIRSNGDFSKEIIDSLCNLWERFKNLSYMGRSRSGLAGVVGISKVTLLLTDGRVGPAFDSTMQRNLCLSITSSNDWIEALRHVSRDIHTFENNINIALPKESSTEFKTLQDAAPTEFKNLHSGRLYDMALGPRKKEVS